MSSTGNHLFRRQTAALVIRTFHWQRRQYCTLFCNFILPSLALVLLSVLSNVIQPQTFNSFPFQEKPKGAFAPRPFDPRSCLRSAVVFKDEQHAIDMCEKDPFQPAYRVPVYAHPSIQSIVGERGPTPSVNFALLSEFSLDPFVYPAAIDPQSPFYQSQTSYDGIFLSLFDNNRSDPIYQFAANVSRNQMVDRSFKAMTRPSPTRDDLYHIIHRSWFNGGAFSTYSTALAFDAMSSTPSSLSITTTVFYNETEFSNCTIQCALPSTVIRLYNAIYKVLAPGKSAFSYLRRMPLVDPHTNLGIIELVISVIIGLLTHFLLPSFLRFLVLERSARLRSMMASMGLRRFQYWFGTYISLLLTYSITILILIVVGVAVGIPFFTFNSPLSYVLLFFLWGNVLISLAMFLEPFFVSPETAQTIGWLFVLLVNLIGGPFIGRRLASQRTSEGSWAAIMLLPSFSYMRSLYYAGAMNSGGEGVSMSAREFRGVQLGMCADHGPFCRTYVFLIGEWFVFMLLAAYFDRVLPTALGTRMHPLFFLGRKRRELDPVEEEVDGDVDVEREKKREVGADVTAEAVLAREIVSNIEHKPFDGVVLDRLSKTYGGKVPVHALRHLSLVAKRGDVLCLLAHNGAGKTTAFCTLTGELEPTGGSAYICGHSIVREMDLVHRKMGVAPQQDILWDVLSTQEHLFFYGRVKNLGGRELRDAVGEALEAVQLGFARRRQVRKLSGGMKRRLSVSIAMMGGPDIIALDEPSTGLDVMARERLWEAIGRVREGRTILLTTHSLEEAEALSTRVAIMSQGELRCIGTAEELKLRLGCGHRLSVCVPEGRVAELHSVVLGAAPEATVDSALGGNVEYVLPREMPIAAVLSLIASKRVMLQIRDWAIQQSSLEDVFLRVTKESQRE